MQNIRKYHKEDNYSYSLGVFTTIELLQNRPQDVLKVLLSNKSDRNKGVDKIKDICQKNNIEYVYADGQINRVSDKENTYAVGVFEKYNSQLESIDEKNQHLVLVRPLNAGNMGTNIRTAVAFGIKNIAVIRPAVDIFNPQIISSSMGAIFSVNIEYFDSLELYMKKYNPKNCYSFVLAEPSSRTLLNQVTIVKPASFVFGNEGEGLTDSELKFGQKIMIEQSDNVDSLNLSVAVGIGLYRAYIS